MHFIEGSLPSAGNCWTGVFANFFHQLSQKAFPKRRGEEGECLRVLWVDQKWAGHSEAKQTYS